VDLITEKRPKATETSSGPDHRKKAKSDPAKGQRAPLLGQLQGMANAKKGEIGGGPRRVVFWLFYVAYEPLKLALF